MANSNNFLQFCKRYCLCSFCLIQNMNCSNYYFYQVSLFK